MKAVVQILTGVVVVLSITLVIYVGVAIDAMWIRHVAADNVEFYEGQLRGYGMDRPTHVFIDNQWRELSYPNGQFIGVISTRDTDD